MGGKNKTGKYVKFAVYLVVVILVNIAGITLFFRIDLTANKQYSLALASKKMAAGLSEPLTIKVFFTRDLPAPHNNTERYLHDLLEEYAVYAGKYFNYRFYDVSPEEGDVTEKTLENQKLANNYGIHPVQIQVVEKDEIKFQKAYMGLVLIYGDLIERIGTISSINGLEYKLTTTIEKMKHKIGVLQNLPGKIDIKLFLSYSLQRVAPLMGLKNLDAMGGQIKAIVDRLNRKNYDRLRFESDAPAGEQEIAALAKKYNIMALSWPAIAKGNIAAGKGVIGLVMVYEKKSLTIPLLQVIRLPLIGTQYQLADLGQLREAIDSGVERLININEDLGYLADHGTLNLKGMVPSAPGRQAPDAATNFHSLVSQNYTLKNVALKDRDIPQSLNCLVIAKPTEKFSDYELFQIDQFLMQGKSLALVLERFKEVMPPGQQGMGRPPVYMPLDTGLEKLLEYYGVRIQQSYVLDKNCFRQEMSAQFGGGEQPIYYAPMIKNRFINKDLAFMKNIKVLVALKISPLELLSEAVDKNAVKAYRLFASSEKSWLMRDRINFNPMFIKPPPSTEDMHSYPLAYLLEGEFPSYFADRPRPVKAVSAEKKADANNNDTDKDDADKQSQIDLSRIQRQGQFLARGKAAKIFIMASADMLKNNVLDAEGKGANSIFIMNVLDYLNDREDMAILRSKEQRFNPLEDTAPGTKTFVKAFNIAGLPVLVVLFGLGVWFKRHTRKKRIRMMFEK
jgi:ABC-type uncharacterized transport system involved in gliding motility auxiliary subunit